MARAQKLIRLLGHGFMPALVLSLCACANLPDKSDVAIGKERFEYSLRGTGAPVVVFEAGLGDGMDTWAPIYNDVAAYTAVFAYDRRGYGESGKPVGALKMSGIGVIVKAIGEEVVDAVIPAASTVVELGLLAARSTKTPVPRSGATIVAELHAVLKKADVPPPYVLVGHSLGGLYLSLYARTYPEEVAGLILLDATHPEQIERCQLYLPAERCDPAHYPWWAKTLISMGPEVPKAEMAGAAETGRQIRAAGPLPNIPLVVLSRGKSPVGESDREQMWTALQRDLVNQSPRGTHIIARQSGHYIQKDEPELVIQTIKDLVMQVRQGHMVMGIPK